MSDLPPSPIAGPARQQGLDAVRGLAVLGILVMNVVEFGLPMRAYGDPSVAGGASGLDLWTWYGQAALFDGRMRALFSMLFGAGIVLLADRMRDTGRGAATADLLLRRCLWLIPLGIVHRFVLQWTGDILYIYGLLGALAVALRDLRPRTQMICGVLALAMSVPIEWRKYEQAAALREQASQAASIEAAGGSPGAELERAASRWQRRTAAHDPADADAEVAAMRGSWLDVARFRWDHNHAFQHAFVYYYFVWDVLGMMLVGMALQRRGFWTGELRSRTYAITIVAGVVAAAVSLVFAVRWGEQAWSKGALELLAWRDALYPFLRGATGLAEAALLLLLLRAEAVRRLLRPLAAVGRMAFSNYVLQTLCCTALFFGWGAGRFGHWSRAELMLVVLAVSALQLLASVLWLARFRFGPLEWVWRSLTYWRRQPLRRDAVT